MGHEEIRESMEHVIGVEPSLHQDGQAHYLPSQGLVSLFPLRGEPLSGAGSTKDLAGTCLRCTQVSLQTPDASAALLGP
jgi:hypothetical protein